jgi:hypothetical protein
VLAAVGELAARVQVDHRGGPAVRELLADVQLAAVELAVRVHVDHCGGPTAR